MSQHHTSSYRFEGFQNKQQRPWLNPVINMVLTQQNGHHNGTFIQTTMFVSHWIQACNYQGNTSYNRQEQHMETQPMEIIDMEK